MRMSAISAANIVAGAVEQRAAMRVEKHALLSSLRFFRLCGAVLVVANPAGFIWQHWQ